MLPIPSIRHWFEKRIDRPVLEGPCIDVSHHQGEIDWPLVYASGIRTVYIKATEGVGYVDPRYYSNCDRAYEAGLKVGAYHFARIDSGSDPVKDARAEMKSFWEHHTYGYDTPPALDVELGGIKRRDPAYCRKWWAAATQEITRLHRRPPLQYTGRWTLRWVFQKEDLPSWLTSCGLWWAEYSNGDAPKHVPSEWENNLRMWQHTAKGRVPGIRGKVDLNRII